MKVLFVGLGSIGQRHLRNLLSIAGKEVEIAALRSTAQNQIIQDGGARACASLVEHYGIQEIKLWEQAAAFGPEMVFVTNPTTFHLETALWGARAGCDLFIEKPLADRLEGVDELSRIVQARDLCVMVGYQTRFHPVHAYLRAAIGDCTYGALISAHFEWGTYLPSHHPYEDYRNGYAARKDLGGGVVLGLIHELDLVLSLIGEPVAVFAIEGRSPHLNLDCEDTVSALLEIQIGEQVVPVSIFLSYAHTHERRLTRLQFESATVFANWRRGSLQVFDRNDQMIEMQRFSDYPRDRLFLEEIRELLNARSERRQPVPGLKDGLRSLRLAMRIKEAINGREQSHRYFQP